MTPLNSQLGRKRWAAMLLLAGLALLPCGPLQGEEAAGSPPSAEAIVQRMLEMNTWRARALQRYSSRRSYFAENKRFGKQAEVVVTERYVYPGYKRLKVVSETGSSFVRRRVIDKLLDAEVESSDDEKRDQTQVTPENYAFELLGREELEGRPAYILAVHPHEAKKYLMEGRIWIDVKDFAIVRMEGKPAKKPSIWIRKASFVRSYKKLGPFWLPASMESVSDLWVVGRSRLEIRYSGYRVNKPEDSEELADSAPATSSSVDEAAADLAGPLAKRVTPAAMSFEEGGSR